MGGTFHAVNNRNFVGVPGPGVREGDSGGGLLFKDSQFNLYFVRGVVSLKPNVDTSIAMFTDVSQYISWITMVSDEQDNVDVRITRSMNKKKT